MRKITLDYVVILMTIFLGIGLLIGNLHPIFIVQRLNDGDAVVAQLSADENKSFFSDKFVIHGKDKDNNFLLEIALNRRGTEGGKYIHYYTLDMIYGDSVYSDYFQDEFTSSDVVPNSFLQSFTALPADDGSTREGFVLSLYNDSKVIDITVNNLKGDFIVKNNIDYTKYVSVGAGRVIGLSSEDYFDIKVAHTRIYAADQSKYVFFEGSDTISVDAKQFVLWDELDNFYLIDHSDVSEYNPAYKTHTWVLFKNSDGFSRKGFDADIITNNLYDYDKNPPGWEIAVNSPFDYKIELSAVTEFNAKLMESGNSVEGLGVGTISYEDKTMTVSGLFHQQD